MTNNTGNITRPSARAKLCGVSTLSSTRRLGVAAALAAVVLLAGCASEPSYYPATAGYDPYWDYGWPYDGGFGVDGFVGDDFRRGVHDHDFHHDFHGGDFHDHALHGGGFHAGGFHGGGHAGGGHGGRG